MFGLYPLRGGAKARRRAAAVALASFMLLKLSPAFAPVVVRADTGSGSVALTLTAAATEDFDTLANSAGTTFISLPNGWYMTETGGGSRDNEAYAVGSGSNNDGDTYSYGAAGGSDRALGELTTSSVVSTFGAKFTNQTGRTIDSLFVSYAGEQWRSGSTSAAPDRLDFEISADATSLTMGTYTAVNQLDFTSPQPTAAAGALDGNNAANRAAVSHTVTGLNIPDGASFFVRWLSTDITGSDDGLAVDDFVIYPIVPFDSDGRQATDIQSTDDAGYAVAVQRDARIVVAGCAVNASGDKDFALARYDLAGAPDASFGAGGKVTTDFDGANDRAWAVAVQHDGKIVAAGVSFNPSLGGDDLALARYNSDGTLDDGSVNDSTPLDSFGTNGRVKNDINTGNDEAFAVALQPDGKIVVAGLADTPAGGYDFVLARYNADGSLDPTFGGDGIVTTDFGAASSEEARAVVVQPDGKLVAAGYTSFGANGNDFALARYNSDGSLDTTFDGDGLVTTDVLTKSDQAFDLRLQTDARIVAAGSAFDPSKGNKDFALVRYNTDGSLDSTFDADGRQTTDFSPSADVARSVAVQADGRIVAAGSSRTGTTSDDFAFARYNTDGSLDPTFDADGKQAVSFSKADDRAEGVALMPDGRVVAAGFVAAPAGRDFAVARLKSDGSADAEAGGAPVLQPNLVLDIADSSHTVVAGANFTYTLTVTNAGPGDATNVVLSDALPATLTFVGASATRGSVAASGNDVTNNIGTLRRGQSATLTVEVSTSVAKLIANTAVAASAEADANPSNNSATEYTRVVRPG